MRTNWVGRVTLGLMLTAITVTSAPLRADVRAGSFDLELYGGWYDPRPNVLPGEPTVGARFGYNLLQRYFLQATLGYTNFERSVDDAVNTGTVDLELWNFDLAFGYNFLPDRDLTPEVHAGFGGGFGSAGGALQINDPNICGVLGCTVTFQNLSEDSFTLHAGAGVRIDLSDLIYLRPLVQARWYAARDADKWDTEYSVSLGFKFGGH